MFFGINPQTEIDLPALWTIKGWLWSLYEGKPDSVILGAYFRKDSLTFEQSLPRRFNKDPNIMICGSLLASHGDLIQLENMSPYSSYTEDSISNRGIVFAPYPVPILGEIITLLPAIWVATSLASSKLRRILCITLLRMLVLRNSDGGGIYKIGITSSTAYPRAIWLQDTQLFYVSSRVFCVLFWRSSI
jgi:hypothetical protein